MPIFLEIEVILNFVTKLSLTGGTSLTLFWKYLFGWFQLSFKKLWVVLGNFVINVGDLEWFRLISGDFWWFWLV